MPVRFGPGLHDVPDELVTHDGAIVQAHLPPVIDVEVRPAQPRPLDADDRVSGMDQRRIGDGLVTNLADTTEGQRAQGISSGPGQQITLE